MANVWKDFDHFRDFSLITPRILYAVHRCQENKSVPGCLERAEEAELPGRMIK